MVTIHRAYGLRFVIYLNDHDPEHIHVFGDGEAKIDIVETDGQPSILHVIGMKASDRRKTLDVIKENQEWFLSEWNRLQGEGE